MATLGRARHPGGLCDPCQFAGHTRDQVAAGGFSRINDMGDYLVHRLTSSLLRLSQEARTLRFLLWALVGGFVAEAIQVVVSGRTSIGVVWIVMGVIGIGGGFGIGSASIVIAWHSVVSLARFLLNWRAV